MRDIGLFIWVGILILGVVSSIAKSAKRQQQAAQTAPGAARPRPHRAAGAPWLKPAAGDPDARDAGDRRATGRPRRRPRAPYARPRSRRRLRPPRGGRSRPATRPSLRPGPSAACSAVSRNWSAPSSQPRCSASQKPLTTNILDSLTQRSIDLHELSDRVRLFGEYDRNLSAIESSLDVAVHADGDKLLLAGDDAAVARAERVVRRVLDAAVGGAHITPDDVKLALTDSASPSESGALTHTLMRTHRGREVRPRTPGQREFIHAIERFTLTFGIGPAGTGKTYLAIVMAVRALKRREATRIVLSRPAVEAGERLGFLPGDLREKVDPYMRPLFDALGDLLDESTVNKYMERGTLEVAPLAYMRGRTLSDAFVILDEAQNATDDQLKMFLTRLGSGSKMVVTGDVTQIDLPGGQRSGLRAAATRLREIDDIGVVEMDESDVVRHPLVAKIVRAYASALPR